MKASRLVLFEIEEGESIESVHAAISNGKEAVDLLKICVSQLNELKSAFKGNPFTTINPNNAVQAIDVFMNSNPGLKKYSTSRT